MKKLFTIAVISFLTINIYAQIGGLSASKLATICTSTVPTSTIEFEPSINISGATNKWNSNYSSSSLDTSILSNEFGFRFTYGLFDKIETGFALPIDVSRIQWGLKYNFFNKNKLSFGSIVGLNLDFSNQTILTEGGVGLVSTYQYNENLSTDFDVHLLKTFPANNENTMKSFFVGLDNGLYVGDIQYIIGVNYQYAEFDNVVSQNLYLSPGITVETAENFLCVFSLPLSVYGKNDYQFVNFSFALTISID